MEFLISFVLGFLICAVLIHKPITIRIEHKDVTEKPTLNNQELRELEAEMFKVDTERDQQYENMDAVLAEANNVMGGSDRV